MLSLLLGVFIDEFRLIKSVIAAKLQFPVSLHRYLQELLILFLNKFNLTCLSKWCHKDITFYFDNKCHSFCLEISVSIAYY